MNTWKRFDQELPPEGKTILVSYENNGMLMVALYENWSHKFRQDWDFMWQEVTLPPKPVSAKEEAWNERVKHIAPKEGCCSCFDSGGDAACEHILNRLEQCIPVTGPAEYWVENMRRIVEEAYRRNSCIACAPADSWFLDLYDPVARQLYLDGLSVAANIAKEAKE